MNFIFNSEVELCRFIGLAVAQDSSRFARIVVAVMIEENDFTADLPLQPPGRLNSPAEELPKLEVTSPDQAGEPVRRFFSDEQFAAMRALGNLLMPAMNGAPGAIEAGAAEFLDFLLSESPADRQHLYRAGLDALNAQARQQFVAEISADVPRRRERLD